jgi:predicted unusual protein kinase regulating ubiquinone biosynthesis (AarF/ABC1/UbiB family)
MVLDSMYIFLRITKLITLVMCEIIKFYTIKCINCLYKIPTARLELIKKISNKLEQENIVYVKIFQALCLDKNILANDEQEFLLKYTDNVPYKTNEIDYDLLDKLEAEFSITLKSKIPINCGIVGLVFEGTDLSNNKVIIKMLKKDIYERFTNVFDELLYISYICQYIPYINSLKITKLLIDNEEILLNQMNFMKELEAIEIFSEKYKNNKEYVFPKVYRHITEKYNKLLVMENISGLKYKDIENMSEIIKEEFAYVLNKFGILGILYHSVIHCDLHSGNVFFYINNETTSTNNEVIKYKLGIIDFGICAFPNKENQNAYYIFFSDIHHNQNYSNIQKLIYTIIEEKELLSSFNTNKKQQFINEIINCLQLNTNDEITSQLLIDLSKLLNKYDLNFTEEFNKVILSLHTANNFGKQLSRNLKATQKKIIADLNKFNDLVCI